MIKTKLSVSNTKPVATGDGQITRNRRDSFVSRTSTLPPTGIQVATKADSNTVSPNYKAPNFGNPHLVESWRGKI